MEAPRDHLFLTVEGKEELAVELAYLEQIRRKAEGMAEPTERGISVQDDIAFVEAQIAGLWQALVCGELVRSTGLIVAIGSEVTVSDGRTEETVTICGPIASNPHLGRICYQSPLANALLGHGLVDTVEVACEKGSRRLKIVGIRRGQVETRRFEVER